MTKQASVLLIEDDVKISSLIKQVLEEAGFGVECAFNGEEGLKLAIGKPYDAIILDLMLPHMDGLTLLEKVRGQNIETPFLILSAKRSVDDRVQGLKAGGDDYLVKPFAMSELLARLEALIRRTKKSAEAMRLSTADLTLDLMTHEVTRGGKPIRLQSKEFALLECLMRNSGKIVSKETLLKHVWNYNFDPQTNIVDVLIFRLRSKIDKNFEKKLLHTVRGVGYVLEEKKE